MEQTKPVASETGKATRGQAAFGLMEQLSLTPGTKRVRTRKRLRRGKMLLVTVDCRQLSLSYLSESAE
jgi:hypothetical protein